MSRTSTGLLIAAIAVSAILVLQKIYLNDQTNEAAPGPVLAITEPPAEPAQKPVAPIAANGSTDNTEISTVEHSASTAGSADNGLSEEVLAAERDAFFERFNLATLGTEPLSDGDFNAVVAYLKNDPQLLEQFLQQYRENTDPDRAKRLAQILEAFDDDTITSVAEDLVFSGELNSQKAGLDLLADQQVNNPAEREFVSQVLELESNPEVLVSALNALAKPGVATAEQTDRLINQFVLHSSSEDETVRGHSLSLMARWAGERNLNEHFLRGLSDGSEHVRRSAVYLLGRSKHPDDSITTALRGILENSSESQRLRRNALASLKQLGLSKEEESEYRARIAAGN